MPYLVTIDSAHWAIQSIAELYSRLPFGSIDSKRKEWKEFWMPLPVELYLPSYPAITDWKHQGFFSAETLNSLLIAVSFLLSIPIEMLGKKLKWGWPYGSARPAPLLEKSSGGTTAKSGLGTRFELAAGTSLEEESEQAGPPFVPGGEPLQRFAAARLDLTIFGSARVESNPTSPLA
jgi:hypothetical protein